jgi:hypothetical protein
MLLVVALAQTANLRRAFGHVQFVSIAGRTPLLVWFSRVTESCYHDSRGHFRCDPSTTADGLYSEITIIAPLRRRGLFVPAIYCSELRSVELARHYYAMPKQHARVSLRTAGAHVFSRDETSQTSIEARVVHGGGASLRFRARWTWPIMFPSGGHTRALLLSAQRIQLAYIRGGRLGPFPGWLPDPARLLPIGVWLSGLRMELPSHHVGV